MSTQTGKVVSVHVGAEDTLEKQAFDTIELKLDGIKGDRHRGLSRQCWEGDKQPEGSMRRNERQWSAVSSEELAEISQAMQLSKPLTAATLGANLCLQGIADLSTLPRGTTLKFSSGALLMVEEYNPPCSDMGAKIAQEYRCRSGDAPAANAFSQAAKFHRGVVGVIEVAGSITVGDEVIVEAEPLPKWLR